MRLTIDGTVAEITEMMKKLTSAGNTDLITEAITAEKIADKIADKVNTPLISNIHNTKPVSKNYTYTTSEIGRGLMTSKLAIDTIVDGCGHPIGRLAKE